MQLKHQFGTYAHVHCFEKMRDEFKGLGHQPGGRRRRDGDLTGLLSDAEAARLHRINDLRARERCHRSRTLSALDELLIAPMPKLVQLDRLLGRVASLEQMSARSIGMMQTSMPRLRTTARKARALAVAVAEILHFIDAGVALGDGIRVFLVVARKPGILVIGIATTGSFVPVAPAFATAGMMRACRIVQVLGGRFQRGADDERMAFGITFDCAG